MSTLTKSHITEYKKLRGIGTCVQEIMFEDVRTLKRRKHSVPASLTLTSLGKSIEDTVEHMNKVRDAIFEEFVERDGEKGWKTTKHKDPKERKFVFKKDVADAEEQFEAKLTEFDETNIELTFRPCPADAFDGMSFDPWLIDNIRFIFE